MESGEVFTIGHSNVVSNRIIELLMARKIDVVIDIRSVPYSRFSPQFNKNAFAEQLKSNKIAYIFEGERLGGRISDPLCYKNNCLPTRKRNIAELVNYEKLVVCSWYQEGVGVILENLREKNVAIMCSEENPLRCHRNLLVARTLTDMGIKVWHIRHNGELESACPVEKCINWEQLQLRDE